MAVLPTLAANSVDACVTDPPYHLVSIVARFGGDTAAPAQFGKDGAYARASAGFMGKQWDGGAIAQSVDLWREVYRVLKPGAHLLAFGGTRTFGRMQVAIEDAGFEIRDTIMWLYGSGFPKSHDIAKNIDKAERGVPHGGVDPTSPNHRKYKGGCSDDNPLGRGFGAGPGQFMRESGERSERELVDAARQWQGWGTALKPACEPIVLARKPLSEGTVAANVLKWGTGALNIDGCRVEIASNDSSGTWGAKQLSSIGYHGTDITEFRTEQNPQGRWPANVVHDGSDEVVAAFPSTGISSGGRIGNAGGGDVQNIPVGQFSAGNPGFGDEGSAARFFYTAKADSDDRIGSKHPTVKPLDLMQWLVRLVTPKGGLVLDPFAGTGSTGEAAFREGMRATLIEREEEYQADIKRRLSLLMAGPDERRFAAVKAKQANKPIDHGPLFQEQPMEQAK